MSPPQATGRMLSFDLDGRRFQVRAAAVVIDEDHVLLHRAPDDDHWALPGGRVELGESASSTVVREMREELGVDAVCGELLHVSENFFDLKGQRHHEIGLYFLVSLPSDCVLRDRSRRHRGLEAERELEFRWFPVAQLDAVNLRPTFLVGSLANAAPRFAHAVQREHL